MKIKEILNEIQYKSPTTFLDRSNQSEYDNNSVGDQFKWHHKNLNQKTKQKPKKKISRNR